MMLQAIRAKIDQLDLQVLDLLNERMRLVTEIGRLKRQQGQSVFAPEREELLLQALEKFNPGPLGRIGLRAIFREILSASRANQSKLRIVYLGEEHSRDFLAARLRFGASDCYRAEPDWKGAIKSLEKNEADVAVIPRVVFCNTLAKKASEKPFFRELRVCGEINLLREVQSDIHITPGLEGWKRPEQFFVLTNGEGKKCQEGKSVFLFVDSKIKKIDSAFEEALVQKGIRVQSTQALTPQGGRFLCEVEGTTVWDGVAEEITQRSGKSASLTLLGSYPCPNIYG